MSAELRRAALQLAERGKPVFPCRPNSKEPLTPRGFQDATVDRAVILHWWGRWPDANIGMQTGWPSDLFILDIDPRHGGMTTLAKLAAYGIGLDTLEVNTGGGGLHLYLALPPGIDLTNSSRGIKEHFGQGVDCRGNGGYVIVPPSHHPSGGRYSWGPGELQPVPEWLVEVLTAPEPALVTPKPAKVLPFDGHERRQLARFDRILERVAQDREGNRNNILFWAACRLRELQGEGAPEGWTDLLVQAGVAAGLPEAEARRTVASGLRRVAL